MHHTVSIACSCPESPYLNRNKTFVLFNLALLASSDENGNCFNCDIFEFSTDAVNAAAKFAANDVANAAKIFFFGTFIIGTSSLESE